MEFLEIGFGGVAGVGNIEMVGFLALDGVAPDADICHGYAVDGGEKHVGVPVGNLKTFETGLGEGRDLATLAGLVDHVWKLSLDAVGVLPYSLLAVEL